MKTLSALLACACAAAGFLPLLLLGTNFAYWFQWVMPVVGLSVAAAVTAYLSKQGK